MIGSAESNVFAGLCDGISEYHVGSLSCAGPTEKQTPAPSTLKERALDRYDAEGYGIDGY